MSTLTDFHSHILPGVDDGSASLDQSIAMLKKEEEQGITRVVATPHFYAHTDTPEKFLERRAEAEAILRKEMARHPGLPELEVGAEVYFFPGISNTEALSQLTVGGSNFILIEMPMSHWTDRMYQELEQIHIKQGLIPILAHLDRYIAPFQTHGILKKLEQLPVLVQANASFFTHSTTKRMSMRMLREGRIHLLGSDCHDLTDRAPDLGAAVQTIRQRLGEQALEHIHHHEYMVLGGK